MKTACALFLLVVAFSNVVVMAAGLQAGSALFSLLGLFGSVTCTLGSSQMLSEAMEERERERQRQGG